MKLSIIIVSYNAKYFLEHCLSAAAYAMGGVQGEIIVVDNHSSDGNLDLLQRKFPSIKFIGNMENAGFAKANNQGLSIAKGEYILYLNPDTIIAENTLKDCIRFLEDNKDAASLGVQMLAGNGEFLPESKRSFPLMMTSFYKLFMIEKLFPRSEIFGKYGLGFLDKNEIHTVEVLSGAFLMARSSLLKFVGGFDERFFMYGEDIDLSYELQKSGYKNYYLGNLPIVHFKGECTKKGNRKYVKVFYNAMILFVEKHYKSISGVFYIAFLKAAIKARAALSIVKQPFVRNNKKVLDIEHFFLIGDKIIAEKAKEICKKRFPYAHYIFTDLSEENLFAKEPGKGFVFCTGGSFSYEAAINHLRLHAPLLNVFWYYDGADSIIGSSSKNTQGEVIV